MMKFILCCTFALLLTPITWAQTLLVMGDSLSAAYNLRQQDGWVSLMSAKLSQSHPNVNIVNASVSGETTQGGLARFPALLRKYEPKWVILELGANDGLRGYPLETAKSNLSNMIEQAQSTGAKIMVLGNRIPSNYGKTYTDQFFALYADLAATHNIGYVPWMLETVALDRNLMQNDGLHPNRDGQIGVLDHLYPQLESWLNQ